MNIPRIFPENGRLIRVKKDNLEILEGKYVRPTVPAEKHGYLIKNGEFVCWLSDCIGWEYIEELPTSQPQEPDYPTDWSQAVGSIVANVEADLIGRIMAYDKERNELIIKALDKSTQVQYFKGTPEQMITNPNTKSWWYLGNLDWVVFA